MLGALSSAPGYFGFLSAVVLVALKTLPSRTKIVLSLSWVSIAALIFFGIASRSQSAHILGVREIFYILTAFGCVIWGSPVGIVKFGIDRDSLTGFALIVAFTALLVRIRPRFSLLALPIALTSLGLASIAAVGISRPYLGNWHLQLVLPSVCGIYSAAYIVWRLERSRFNTILFSGVVLLLLLNLDGSYLGFTKYGPSFRADVSEIEDYILSYTPSLEKPFPHPGDRDIDAEMIDFLRGKHHPLFEAQRRR